MTWSPDDKDLLAYDADGTDLDLISADDAQPQVSIATVGGIYAVGSFQRLAP